MSEELKPCPFCGGDDILFIDGGKYSAASIVCRTCFAEAIDTSSTPLIEVWNRRAPSHDMREAVEALERANALTSAGNRTFDELTRDVTRANGEIRMALNIAYALTGAKP